MDQITLNHANKQIGGSIEVPGDKSISHRAVYVWSNRPRKNGNIQFFKR